MIQFEVGKSYALHLPAKDGHGKTTFLTDIYTVTRRTPCYLTFSHISHDGTKMPHCRCKIFTSDSRGEFVHATAFFCLYADSYIDDDSQPDEIATAKITNASDNDNAMASQHATATTAESETKAQHEIVKFEVGKTYRNDSPDFCYSASYTITGKSRQFVSFESYFLRKQAYKKLRIGTDRNGILCEYFDDKEKGSPYPAQMVYATALDPDIPNNEDSPVTAATPQTESAPAIIYGMSDVEKALRRIKSKSKHTPAEIAQPEALYMDDSYSDAPGDNSCPDMDIPDDHNPLHIVQTWCGHSRSDAEMLRIDRKYEATQHNEYFIFAQFMPSMSVQFCLAKSEKHAINMAIRLCKDFRIHCNKSDIRVEKLCNFFPDWTDFLPRYMDDSLSARVFRDFHYDPLHFFRDKGIHERKNDNPADNPGFTVVPSEKITRPDCTVYQEPITDECPYVTVSACDKPENTPRRNSITEAKFKWVNQFLLAVFFLCKFIIPVLCAKKSDTHKKFQIGEKYNSICYCGQPCIGKIVGFHEDHYDGEWHKAIMIEYVKNGKYKYDVAPVVTDKGVEIATWCGYPRCEFHADMLIHEATTSNHDMRTPEMRFVVGQDYRLMSYKEEKFTATITARTKNTVSFTCEELFPKGLADIRFFTAPIYIDTCIIRSECFRVPLLGVCDSANDIPKCSRNNQWCADMPDAVQEVPAEINNITPESKAQPKTRKHNPAPASELEHKLIETKDLHFSEKRKALDHNAAVISSCMFSEAVISLLSSISLQAILQLGFHMRLFIAKPKGKKNVVADLFAKRLIEYRELRANVRSTSDNITANNSASVPDGVKFFETKHRQLGFIFTE